MTIEHCRLNGMNRRPFTPQSSIVTSSRFTASTVTVSQPPTPPQMCLTLRSRSPPRFSLIASARLGRRYRYTNPEVRNGSPHRLRPDRRPPTPPRDPRRPLRLVEGIPPPQSRHRD